MSPPDPKKIAAALAIATAIAGPVVMQWEGKRNDPYQDVVGVWTVCFGETKQPMRRYSDAQCKAMLTTRLRDDYAAPILKCVPGLAARPHVFAASTSLAYNIGVSAFCRSTVAKRFNAGQWRAGCDGFGAWVKAGGKVWPGLVNRRKDETRLCMKGVA
jgi:lysozyme